jgi:geranylgeranyl transferase type-2 subunit beta
MKSFLKNALVRAKLLAVATLALSGCSVRAAEQDLPKPPQVLAELRAWLAKTARPDGSFANGLDPAYQGMSDSVYSDLAAVTYAVTLHKTFGWDLPHEQATRQFLISRQQANGDFFNRAGTVDPKSAEGRVYNTTQAIVALHALGARPEHDPLRVFEEILQQDYKTLPAYSTSFFPLAYLAYGVAIPAEADRRIRATMRQAADGYLNDHIAATFHAVHYYRLVGEPTPMAERIIQRVLREQKADGSWLLNMPSRDRHATFDAVFTLRQLGYDRPDCRAAIQRAAIWALKCRNADGGFGHFPGSTSDADANYFQVGTLVMAGFLEPASPLPKDAHLLSWGHLMPLAQANAAQPVRSLDGRVIAEQFSVSLPAWVGSLSFSADEQRLAAGCADSAVHVLHAASGEELAVLRGHEDSVASVAFAAHGSRLASGSYDHTARLWVLDGAPQPVVLRGHGGVVMSVAFSPDDQWLATGSLDRSVKIWDALTGNLRTTLTGHKSWVNAVTFSPDGERLISGSSDGTIQVWRTDTAKLETTLQATAAEVRSVAVSRDGRTLAAGVRYGMLKTWQLPAGQPQAELKAHESDIWSLAFLPKTGLLITGNGDWRKAGQVKLWNTDGMRLLQTLPTSDEVLAVSCAATEQLFAAGCADGSVTVWRFK